MAIAVRDVEALELPPAIEGLESYERALILIRWQGAPVATALLPVRRGCIAGDELRLAVVSNASSRIWKRWYHDHINWEEYDPGVLPAFATIAVCTRDRPQDLERCLAAIGNLPDDGQEVLVVDSASIGQATREVAASHPGVKYVREERPGLDIARNRALREARGEIVAFVDDDAAPDRQWLRELARNFGDARTLCVTGLTLPSSLETRAQEWFERTNYFGRGFDRRVFDGMHDHPFKVARIGAGVNMALRRSVLELIGPFDEALDAGTPARSGGDHDMFARIMLRGYRVVYEPRALSWHTHRREWGELRDTIRGYGTGVYALLTANIIRGELRAAGIGLGWLRSQLSALARRILRRPHSTPADLTLAELRGCFAGPGAYLKGRRKSRRNTLAPAP